jgi:hypothetical protein
MMKKKKDREPKDKKPKDKKPRQPRLPGMDDPAIEELETAAQEYATIRDQRMALNEEESELKTNLLAMMHKYEKKKYVHEGVEIRIVNADETVKVKIKKDSPEPPAE